MSFKKRLFVTAPSDCKREDTLTPKSEIDRVCVFCKLKTFAHTNTQASFTTKPGTLPFYIPSTFQGFWTTCLVKDP